MLYYIFFHDILHVIFSGNSYPSIIGIRKYAYHYSEIRGLYLMKMSRETL